MNGQCVRAVLMLAVLALAACGSGGGDGTSGGGNGGPGPAAAGIQGMVHGGQSPVSGSTVTLYTAGSGLADATVLGSATTDGSGNWGLSSYTCPSPDAAAYVVASGGNPGLAAGTNNGALKLMAALGPCGALGGSVNIDEVTTVAAAYALNGFIGPAGCIDCGGVPTGVSNVHGKNPGLANAMGNAARLASVTAGLASPPLPSASACAASAAPVNCGVERQENALANALAACVNSTGPASAQCVELFACATPGATFDGFACTPPAGSALAADTLSAVLEIARNPAQVPVAGVYDVATRNAVFSPAVSAAPNDWTLALQITGAGLNGPHALAIDAAGNAWVANYSANVVSEFSPAGVPLSGSGYAGGGLNGGNGIAIDMGGNVWVSNFQGGSLSEFNSSGVALSGNSGYTGGGLSEPNDVAIDPNGNVWIANSARAAVSEFNPVGTALSGGSGYSGGGLNDSPGVAVDATGNVWVSNLNGDLSEFNASGTALSGSGGYTGGGLDGNSPRETAIDPSGNVWVVDAYGLVSEFNAAGVAVSGSGYAIGQTSEPLGIAIDAGGKVWTANYSGSVSELGADGTVLSGSKGLSGSGAFAAPVRIAVDPSGDVWVANQGPSLVEMIGAATPTRTPLVSAINNGFVP